jgi:hypothetical protein
MTNQRKIQDTHQHRSPIRWTPERRGTGGAGRTVRSTLAQVWRPVVACALAVPFAVGAMAGVADAGTSGAASSGAPTGSYSGSESQNGNGMSFYVSADQKSLQDVTIPLVGLGCTPVNGGINDHLSIASVSLGSSGSFTSSTKQSGVLFGLRATFTYTFQGSFHGVSASGAPQATGTYSEMIRYRDSVARTCTSQSQSWTAARDTQPTQPKSAPPTGSYSGYESQNGNGMSFSVSADQKHLQNVSVPLVGLDCSPGNGGINDHLLIASVPVSSTGSFDSTTTQTGTISGLPATFTYTFRGNFHGVDAAGAERAAGTYTETITYTDSTVRDCTSDSQWWYASLK